MSRLVLTLFALAFVGFSGAAVAEDAKVIAYGKRPPAEASAPVTA